MTSVSQSQPPLAIEQPVQEQPPAAPHEQLEGLVARPGTEADLRHTIEQAFSYRGDMTVITTDGRKIEGYIFDRLAESPSLQHCFLRLLPPNGQDRIRLAYSDIAELHFTGRDAAVVIEKRWSLLNTHLFTLLYGCGRNFKRHHGTVA